MTAVAAESLYKVFGRRPIDGVQALERGANREKLMAEGLTPAVIDASFDVEPGEIFVVMGLSGSGKSTLIRMMNGLLEPTSGEVVIGDQPISRLSPSQIREVRREKVSMVFQHFALFPHRTVGENAAYALEIQGMNKAEREAKAGEALRLVGLEGWENYRPGDLSGGMQQRVGLARALAAETDILLMDESFSALDPLIRKDMQDQLVELQQSLEKTVLFITHDLNEAMRLGDRIAMMRDGRIEQVGTAEEILREPANDYVARFTQDVDRSKVLTAQTIMEQPPSVLAADLGPRAAHKLLRETQNSYLVVLEKDRTPKGVLWEEDVARALREDEDELPWSPVHHMPLVCLDTPVSELFADSAQHKSPLVVVDDEGKFEGVVPRITLLTAAGSFQGQEASAPPAPEVTQSKNGSEGTDPLVIPAKKRPGPGKPKAQPNAGQEAAK